MDLTKSQHPNSIVLSSAKIEITSEPVVINKTAGNKGYYFQGLEDLGLARGVSIAPVNTKIEILADNGTVPLKGITANKRTVTFNLLERHIPILGKLMAGLVKVTAIPGTETPVTENFAAGSISKDKPVPFSRFNYNGAAPADVVLSQGSTTLVLDDDYRIIEYAGAYFFVITSPDDTGLFDPDLSLKVTYTVTPAASYKMASGSAGVSTNLAMRLTNKRKSDDGRIISRIWELPYGIYNGDDTITLKSKNDGDNALEVPMSFEFSPHPDMVDDQDLEPESLIRETQEV